MKEQQMHVSTDQIDADRYPRDRIDTHRMRPTLNEERHQDFDRSRQMERNVNIDPLAAIIFHALEG